ncbi:MAG TPA: Abi family protein [Candidatus Paceibacterota bacterium]|nr:Abi family protein [Candidatus Paceibacterota bacterium]
MSTTNLDELITQIGADHFRTFLRDSNHDSSRAVKLYLWNKCLSSALWEIIADTEIFMRSAMDVELQTLNVTLGNAGSWFHEVFLDISPERKFEIIKAEFYVTKHAKPMLHPNIVAELTLGFWRSLLTKRYKDTLWRNALRFSFPNAPTGQPEYIFTRVHHLNILRNRIAHHEPIHRRDIARDFQICIEVLYAISPAIAQWTADNSRVLQLLAERP